MSGLQSLRALMLVLVAVAVAVDAASNIPRPAANGLSHSGNEFLLAFLENDPADPGAETVTIYVSTDEPTPVNFTVETDSRFSPSLTSGTASYGSTMPVTFSITDPNDIRVTIVTSSSDINDQIDSRSIRVKAEDGKKITVFGVNDKTVSNDAFLALPCQSYNGVTTNTPYEYFIFSTNQNPGLRPNYRSAFLIVTCEDSTAITVRPSETALFQQGQMFNLIPQPQGSLNANARQTIVINTDNSEKDLTGTIVTSTKPISIFSGHVCGRVPADQTACDHLIEQVPPHMVWGTTFFTVPLALRRSGDRFRVGAIRDNTVINVTCVTRGSSTVRFRDSVIRNRSPTPPGSNYYQFQTPGTSPTNPDPNFERDYCCIQTNYPVSVVQYSEGHSADELPEQRGDPFMMLVPPVEQSLNNFTVSTPASNRFEDYINIAVSTEFFNNSAADQAKVQLNGATVTPVGGSWTPITCYDDSICGYGAQVSLSDGASTVVFDDPSGGMNVYTYGFGTEVTYGYPGGFKMEPIGFAHVTLSPVNITVPESAGMVNIQVIRSGDISLRSRVYFNTRSTPTISATAGASCSSTGSDYVQPAQGTADRPSNTRRKRFRDFQTISVLDGPNITIPICNDDVPEGTETFEVYLTDENLQNAYFFPYRVATVTILDDDGNFSVQFDPASYTVDEADGVVSITIVADRAAPSANDGAALFYTMDGTATAGNDFTGITSANAIPVRFPVGSRNTTVTVPITNDGEFEGMEQFFGRLRRSSTAPANFRIPVDTATVLITEAVTAVTVEFDPTSYTVSESDRYANITVVKRGQTTQTVNVTFSTADGNATAGQDYTTTSQTVTFAPSETSRIVMVPIINDDVYEGLEQFTARLSLPAGATGVMLGTADTATVDITDNDAVTVEFDPTSYTVSESDRYANITVVKRGQTTQTVSVSFTTADGTATAGQDYTTTSQTVTFAPSEDSRIVMVPIINDNIGEGVEQFTARLSVPAGQSGVVLGEDMATVEIIDDDPVTVEFDPTSYTVDESDRFANITVVKRGQTTQTVSVSFTTADGNATAGQDYTTTSQTVTFAPSEDSRTVMVPIINDNIGEGVEQFTARLSVPAGQSGVVLGEDMATVEIIDDDPVTVEFDPTSYTVSESDRYANITVVKRGQTTQTVSVSFTTADGNATAGQDYTTTSQTVTFAPSETSRIVMVPIIDDSVGEGVEQFTARLSVPAGQSGVVLGEDMATVEITDDDPVTVEFDPASYTVSESDRYANITVVKRGQTTQTVSVSFMTFSTDDGLAIAGQDYTTTSQTVTFAPSEDSRIVMVPIIDDNIGEGVEFFFARLSVPAGQSGVVLGEDEAIIEITDDDPVTVEFEPTSYTVDESDRYANITIVKRGETTLPVIVSFTTADGSAIAGLDYTATAQPVTFAPSEMSQIVRVPIIEDARVELDETFNGQLTLVPGSSGVVLGAATTATVTITDDDNVMIQFDPTGYMVAEGSSTMLRIVKIGVADVTVSVSLSTVAGTADQNDFTPITNQVVTFQAGETERTVDFTSLPDDTSEGTENLTAVLSNPSARAMIGPQGTAMINITDDAAVIVQFDPISYTVTEADGAVVRFRVVKLTSTTQTVSVLFSTSPGTATDPADFSGLSNVPVTFAPGETVQYVNVSVANDAILEGDEMFTATLTSTVSTVMIGSNNTATATIVDNDMVEIGFNPTSYTVNEDDGTVTLIVRKTGQSEIPVTVDISTSAGSAGAGDFTGISRTLTFPAGGDDVIRVPVPIINDTIAEGTEDFFANLDNVDPNDVNLGEDLATIMIIDNDVVEIGFNPTSYTVNEDDGTVTLIVQKTGESEIPVTVDISTSAGSAGTGDFTGISRTLTFPAGGDDVIRVPVPITNDTIAEGTEEFFATLDNVDPNDVNLGEDLATIMIIDNDVVEIEFDPTSYTVNEDDGTVTLIVRKTGENEIPVTVDISTSPDSAGTGDFTGISRTLTFPAGGDDVIRVPVPIINDTIAEGTEEFFANLDNVDPNDVNLGEDTATIMIIDNDVVEIEFDPTSYTVNEDDGTVTLIVRKTGENEIPVTVDISTSPASAGTGDFTGILRTLTFPAGGDDVIRVPVPITNDTIAEGTEEFFANLDNVDPNDVNLGEDTATIMIIDNDVVEIEFNPTSYTVNEDDGTVTLIVRKTGENEIPVTVDISTSPDSAGTGDFTGILRTLTFPAGGDDVIRVPVPITNDTIAEGTEEFFANLDNVDPNDVNLGEDIATITIIDNDAVTIGFTSDNYRVREDNGTVTVCVMKTGTTAQDIPLTGRAFESTPPDAIAGQDFIAGSVNLVFPANATELCTTVPILNDTIAGEGDEEFTVDFTLDPGTSGVQPGRTTSTVTIIDNDVPTVVPSVPNVEVPENNGTVTVCFNTTTALANPHTIQVTAVEKTTGNIATAGDDFTPATRTITFPASATPTQACTSFNITDDTIGLEGNEMFTVRVDPSGPESWVTIIDDDVVEVEFVQPVYTVPEANNATVCLQSNSGSKRDVQVTVTVSEKTPVDAEDGLDFNSGTPRIVTFPAGNSGSEMCIVIHIIDDALEEQPEGFNVDFSFVNDTGVRKGPIAQTMVIIMDDEMIAVMFVNPNVTVPENNGTVTICLDVNRGISTPLPVVLIAEEKPSAGADAATDGDDFTAGVRTVTFPPSPNPGRVCTNFTILDDQIGLEGNERFTVRLNFTGQEACVTIVDDDVVEVEFVQDMYTVPEANGSATVCLRSNIETKRDLVIRVTASNKSPAEAEDGMDYISGTPRSITFPADVTGGSTRCTSFSIINDTIQEGNEGFNVDFTFVDGMGARKGTVAQSMVIITDDDVATVVPSVPNVEVPEDNGTVTVCFNTTTGIANPLTRQVTAEQKTTGNIATAGDDFTPATRTIRFPASTTPTQACTSYNIINDTLGLEGNETFTVRVEPSGPESWVTIIDDDVVEVEFVQPVYTVPEANGSVTVCLQSNIGTEVDFNITVTVSEKSPVDAQDGLDFRSGPPRTVTFPAGDTGLTECIDIEIINDDVALENDEGFNVDFEFVPKEGVRKGSIPQSMVVITDEDVVVIDFQTASVTVNENNGTVTVCLEKDKDTDEPIVVQVTEDEGTASDGTDFIAEARNITFAPNARVACTSLPLIDDNTIEQPEAFRVNFMPLVPGTVQRRIMRGMREVANVTIIDDDAATNVTICSVTEPLIVSPFQISVNYSFRGSCEHVILSVCDGSPDLRITVDFLADTLQNGRIGASHMGRMYVSREDGTVSIDSNTEVISMSGSTMIYQGNVAITRDSAANRTTIEFQDLGVTIVHQLGQDPFFQVNISDTSTLGETCGLCGTTEGVLRHRNGNTANIMNRTEVDAFANSYLVAPRDQFLHSQRRECGQVTNDTVIGDPLFTVPINSDGRSLCFEIHGEPNRIFNLVSDQCTSINANYTAMNIPENGNIISQIGVRAVPSDGQCKNVRVELEGCRAFIGSAEVIGIRNEENVAVRRMRNRVRISVPNCDNLNLVMWVMCQNISRQPMIRFVITRGLNLRPTSHGLLGQFWNIPLNATRFNGTLDRSGGNLNEDELYVVTVTPQDGSPPRSFLAEQFVRTWENRPGPCLYAGNAQGGWSGEVNSLNSPVIQGGYKDYIVNELFETDYTYSRFDEQNCPLN